MEYASFLTRRTGQAILVLIGLSIVMFVLARVVPGDPGRLALGPTATASQVKGLDHDFGRDQPIWIQSAKYLGNATHGDFGTALLTRRGVAQDMADTFPATLELVLASTILVVGIGVPLGVLAAVYRDSPIDTGTRLLALVGVAVPDFLIGIGLQLICGYWLGILPISGQLDPNLHFSTSVTGMVVPD
ncbi:MAG: ABC transporter permease, partial [Chloroflexota bacterium]